MTPATTRTISGLTISQRVGGEGHPLLMLHGWGADSSLLWPLAERLLPLGYRVYAPDLPGFGSSAPPPAVWSVHEYAAFVLDYMQAHGLDKVYLFGHSFGGRLGLVLGAQQPQRIYKMVLADSAGVRPTASAQAQFRLNVYKTLRDGLRAAGLKRLSEKLRAWYAARYGSADYKAAGALRETFVRVVNEDLLPYAARVQVSTLLLWGEKDADTPLWQGQTLAKTIPDAGLVVLPGAGHYSYLDALAHTVTVIDYFYKQP
ncbi:MAG: alpha/beta hydrolase [Chloroflexi bacterium]|nr:alpha/beta hydrolase [Chloroflexota bacterium]